MYRDVLDIKQQNILPLIKTFNREFYLAGGTAIALHIGHRQSIDFDLFKKNIINKKKIIDKLNKYTNTYSITYQNREQININILENKLTFFTFNFDVPYNNKFENIINTPSLIDLSAMKAYALGNRAKWKDYVDLFFIIKYHYKLDVICKRASEIFDKLFVEKLFIQQLSYYNDIDYSEKVIFVKNIIADDEIKNFLTNISANYLNDLLLQKNI